MLWGPAIEETLLYECAKLETIVPLECWHEVREQPVPKLLKKEYMYVKLLKRIKPLTCELVFVEQYHINFYETYATRVIIEPAQERMVTGYFDASLFDTRAIKANALRSKKEQERNMIKELKTDNLKNIQILIDKNGREYPIDNEDIYGDDEDSDKETMIMKRKGKGDTVQRMKQRKASGKVVLVEYKDQMTKDKRFGPQNRMQGYQTGGHSVNEGSRQSRKDNKSESKSRGGNRQNQNARLADRQNFIVGRDVQDRNTNRSKEGTYQHRNEQHFEASNEESLRNQRSQSNGRNTRTSQGNRSGYLHGSSRKDVTTALPSTTEMRRTHGGFYKPAEGSRDRIAGYYQGNDDRGNENSFETEDLKFSNRVLQRESRTANKEKKKLPVIRIMDRHNQSRRNLSKITDNEMRDHSRGKFDDEDGSGREDITERNEDEPEEGLYKSRSK